MLYTWRAVWQCSALGIQSSQVDVISKGGHLEIKLIFQAATWLLVIAFLSGLAMAGIRFASDKPSPPWLAKLHGFAAVSAISLLTFCWATIGLGRAGTYGLLILLIAAASGIVLNLAFHWLHKPLPEWLVFAHMCAAFLGFLIVGLVGISLSPP